MKIWESTRKCPQLHREKFGEYVEWLFFERDPSQEPQMGILLSNSYSISVASCKEPLNDELSLRFRTLGRCTHTISTKSSHGAIYKNTDSINRATCFPSSGVGAMSIACYLRLASCGSPLENAGLLVIVIADDAKDGNPCSKGCHESLVTNKGSASHHFELQPGQLRNSLLAEKE